jgi:hypothetical protein
MLSQPLSDKELLWLIPLPSLQLVQLSSPSATSQPKHEPAKVPGGRLGPFSGSTSHTSLPYDKGRRGCGGR